MAINQGESSIQPPVSICYSMKNNNGFTMVEVLMVMAIIGALATLSINAFYVVKDRARTSRTMSEIRVLEKDITAYAAEKGAYPPDLAAVGRATLRDPWGNPYHYIYGAANAADPVVVHRDAAGVPINSDFDLYSSGPDGGSDASIFDATSDDDIIRGNDGSYVGKGLFYGI